jgi:kumamolisin
MMIKRITPRSGTSYLPTDISKAYNFPAPGDSITNKCVAIIELGGGFNPQDVYNYCDRNKYTRPVITTYLVDGATNVEVGANGADGEVCLDIDIVAAVAPGVNILVVFCPNTEDGFAAGIMAAVNHPLNPCAISISWGGAEDGWSEGGRQGIDTAIQAAIAKNIQVFAASGDNGSNDGVGDSVNHVDYPAASPWAIGCGGTLISLNTLDQIQSQSCWNDNDGATGGGVSIYYSAPSYQTALPQLNASVHGRYVPDISGNAAPQSGYIVDIDGQLVVVGGTSAVAPLYAGLCALICSRFMSNPPDWHPVLYNYPVTVDVSGGNNGAYPCTTGFDLCTGLGWVDGSKLLSQLALTNNLKLLPPAGSAPTPVPAPPAPTPAPVPPAQPSWWAKFVAWLKSLV